MGGCSSALLVPSGERYEGKWYHGNKIGEGKYYYKDGSVYEGNFFEDRRHGKGTMNFANGDVYKGDWRYNVIAGCGELVNKNGDVYVGFFEAGKPCGFGRMQYSDKSSFMCNWRNGLPNGDGQCVTAAGGVYVGGLNDGEFEGQGQLVLATGELQQGTFRAGSLHGAGEVWLPDGIYMAGTFAQGSLSGRGTILHPNGTIYTGSFLAGQFHGQGTLWRDGICYEGSWAQGRPGGTMTVASSAGVRYEGALSSVFMRHGYGTLRVYDITGTQYDPAVRGGGGAAAAAGAGSAAAAAAGGAGGGAESKDSANPRKGFRTGFSIPVPPMQVPPRRPPQQVFSLPLGALAHEQSADAAAFVQRLQPHLAPIVVIPQVWSQPWVAGSSRGGYGGMAMGGGGMGIGPGVGGGMSALGAYVASATPLPGYGLQVSVPGGGQGFPSAPTLTSSTSIGSLPFSVTSVLSHLYAEVREYAGEWRNDVPHGVGKAVLANGDQYTGEWRGGAREGKGRLVAVDGTKSEGEWSQGRLHGLAVVVYPDGSRFEGSFVEGVAKNSSDSLGLASLMITSQRIKALVDELEDAKSSINPQLACKLCLKAPMNTLFLECGHMLFCAACAEGMTHCAVCDKRVERMAPVFRAET